MKVAQSTFIDFVSQSNTVFTIPLFQRPYSWDVEQCSELWDDILNTAEADLPHFAGTILYKELPRDDGMHELSIIDGQQRTLTMFLMLSAFADYLRSSDTQDIDAQKVMAVCDSKRLVPSRRDRDAFELILDSGSIAEVTTSRAAVNKQFFAGRMGESSFDPGLFWKGVHLLIIVSAELGDEDDAQAIFESFNSKGVSLNTADLVRNYLLMAEDSQGQLELYEQYWEPSQGLFGDDPGSLRMNTAVKAWISIRCKGARAKSDTETFATFRRYAEHEYEGTTQDLLDELYSFCNVWAENYRYHAVKKFRSANWAKLGRKTLVSGRERTPVSKESWDYYTKHFGVDSKW